MIATRHLVEVGALVILGALVFAIGWNGELLLSMLVALIGVVLIAGVVPGVLDALQPAEFSAHRDCRGRGRVEREPVMSPAKRLPVHDPGERFYTVDHAGQARLWQVAPDGLLVIVPPAPPLVLPDPPEAVAGRYTVGDDDDPDYDGDPDEDT